ncbi:hypothetical protein C8Q75DRAFT_747010 [Abortiporus biennis]|nr:hypothetical protein C8Q75DRAFT_747010 [Abortiporus biennis]
MTLTFELTSILQMYFECPICFDTLISPICPPCGHVMCQSCLTDYIKTQPDPSRIPCPSCKTLFSSATTIKRISEYWAPHLRPVFLPEFENPSQSKIEDLEQQLATYQQIVDEQRRQIEHLSTKCDYYSRCFQMADLDRKKLQESVDRRNNQLHHIQAAWRLEKRKIMSLLGYLEAELANIQNNSTSPTNGVAQSSIEHLVTRFGTQAFNHDIVQGNTATTNGPGFGPQQFEVPIIGLLNVSVAPSESTVSCYYPPVVAEGQQSRQYTEGVQNTFNVSSSSTHAHLDFQILW